MDADHIGSEDVDRLAQHRGLGLDAADAPADDADAVDHGGVRVGTDQSVGIVQARIVRIISQAGSEVLEIDLVDDADAGRDHLEGLEGSHAPFEKAVALLIALELALEVQAQGLLGAVIVDLD